MKLLYNRSLKQISILVAAALLGLMVLEISWLTYQFNRVEAIQEQIDFARTIQLDDQQLAMLAERSANDRSLAPHVLAKVNAQNANLELIEGGGRLPGSDVFIRSLQRLPKITYDKLIQVWGKQTATILSLTGSPENLTLFQAQALNLSEWYNRLITDLYDEAARAQSAFTTILYSIIFIDVLALVALVWAFNYFVVTALKRIERNTTEHNHTNGFPKNEIGSLSHEINEVIEQLRDATDFVKSIGEGKLDVDYKAALDSEYVPGKNMLADELIAMQGKLRELNIEDQRRQWANEGLTKFVDILRNANDNITVLGDRIISSLVQYTQANQGGLYVLNEDNEQNKFLELISLFAFNIKKFEKQRIKLGEGILGQTFLEKETTYITNVPDDYVKITSGLGDARPKSILIVPLKVDKQVYGIVELASFREFEPHEISFVEKLGETIASTLSSVKGNQKNRKLLEQFQEQTEQMRAQEEEMRQNMEELTATQEGMHRLVKEAQDKEAYLNNLLDASPDAIVAIDRDYRVVIRNNAPLFEKFLAQGIHYEKGYYVLGLFKREEFDYHKSIYDKAFAGESVTVTKEYFGEKYSIVYGPLRSANGEVIGASIFAHNESDVEVLKAQLAEKEQELKALHKLPVGSTPDDRWKIAEEIEKTLRIQLEALKITQEELQRKQR